MSQDFSYRHLYYFWVVAKEGGVSRAAERLGMAVQTVSTQVRELERDLGHALLKPVGRGVGLTEAGVAAMRQADQIFSLGEQLPTVVRDAATHPGVRLAVGIADHVPKLVVRRLLQPVMQEPLLRLVCQVDEFEDLLADLALHRLDVVLTDRPAPHNPNLKLYSHLLAESGIAWYAPAVWAAAAQANFPHSLGSVPLLLPTSHAAMRAQLDLWFERHGIRPRVVGEFEDSALLQTFGASGMGVFPMVELAQDDLALHHGLSRVGVCERLIEHFYAIGTEKKIAHPLVLRMLP